MGRQRQIHSRLSNTRLSAGSRTWGKLSAISISTVLISLGCLLAATHFSLNYYFQALAVSESRREDLSLIKEGFQSTIIVSPDFACAESHFDQFELACTSKSIYGTPPQVQLRTAAWMSALTRVNTSLHWLLASEGSLTLQNLRGLVVDYTVLGFRYAVIYIMYGSLWIVYQAIQLTTRVAIECRYYYWLARYILTHKVSPALSNISLRTVLKALPDSCTLVVLGTRWSRSYFASLVRIRCGTELMK